MEIAKLDEQMPMAQNDLDAIFGMHLNAHREQFNNKIARLGLKDASVLVEHWGKLREVLVQPLS